MLSCTNGDVVDYLQCQVCHTPSLTGDVHDSCCNYESVNVATTRHFHPILQKLSSLTFFRYFKVNLNRECPYWKEEGMCASRECAVCLCEDDEIPSVWKSQDEYENEYDKSSMSSLEPCADQLGTSDLSKINTSSKLENIVPWSTGPVDSLYMDTVMNDPESTYINLLDNRERYTGYAGHLAERIWKAIHEENCFVKHIGNCYEERVFYRLISGFQTSVNTHIALEHLNEKEVWSRNINLYVLRVGRHMERIENLYFTYLFVMRAVVKAQGTLLTYTYETGNEAEDQQVYELLSELLHITTSSACSAVEEQAVLSGFDESRLFFVETEGVTPEAYHAEKVLKFALEKQFKAHFQNITRIMDCVTCEKCRLWGKIQVLGIGTAIKILLADDDNDEPIHLTRNEVIALINVLTRLSESVDAVRIFRDLEFDQAVYEYVRNMILAIMVLMFTWWVYKRMTRR